MGKINYGRVILGGIVGGIIASTIEWFFNGVLLGPLWDAAMKSLNRPNVFPGPVFLIALYLMMIAGGVLVIWIYAAIRPRFGAGVRTAIYAGLVGWFLSTPLSNLENFINGLFSARLMIYDTLIGLAAALVGTVIGAALYKEAEPTAYPAAAAAPRPTTP
jgi:hypothetical protein